MIRKILTLAAGAAALTAASMATTPAMAAGTTGTFRTDSTDVRVLVETGQVDLGIAGTAPDLPGLVWEPIFRDPVKLVCRSDSALADKGDMLDWDDLTGHPLILNEAVRALPSPAFQRLAAPVLVLGGASDRCTPPAALEALAQVLPDAEHVSLPQVGHWPQLEAPEAFDAALLDFLAARRVLH